MMPETTDDLADQILVSIRRVMRAVDLSSKQLVRNYGVSVPQLVALRVVARYGPIAVTALAREMNLSQPTVTGILHRLEQQGVIQRERGSVDRRAVTSTITTKGLSVLRDTPAPLEVRFRRELSRLDDWEQTQTLATLQRIVAMMEADDLPADTRVATKTLLIEPIADEQLEESSNHSPKTQK